MLIGFIGFFATGLFGIPIGILGNSFEGIIEENVEDDEDEKEESGDGNGEAHPLLPSSEKAGPVEWIYNFSNGIGSTAAIWFEIIIYSFIFLTVLIGILQTVEGHQDDLSLLETIAVIIFTVEYLLRFIGAGADPEFSHISNPFLRRLRYIFSFYSLIDIAAIVPFYISVAMPRGWVDDHDEYFRMLRLLRLLKLDKHVPSISLIGDVFRLKQDMLIVAIFVGSTLLLLFTGLLYIAEYRDSENEIDPVPVYGCDENCTMMDRFRTFLDSLVYTCIHLTGDYPIISYSAWGRVICFFMVIAAVGVVSVPSGLIASGFQDIVQTSSKRRAGEAIPTGGNAGDDWYDISLRKLTGKPPPQSLLGPIVDGWEMTVNNILNGVVDPFTGVTKHTFASRSVDFLSLTLIITNIIAVIMETVPELDRAVGNATGNIFDSFEAVSIFFFSLEYILQLFSAPKSIEALYSRWVYATTFFGIVDFMSTAPWYVEKTMLALGATESTGTVVSFR